MAKGFLEDLFSLEGGAYMFGFVITWGILKKFARLVSEAKYNNSKVLAREFLDGFLTYENCYRMFRFLIT